MGLRFSCWFIEDRCCVVGCVGEGMKISGTPHVTLHHFAEDQNPQTKFFFLLIN